MRLNFSAEVKQPKEDVTLKDIAEVVGKSVAAVSRALNDYDDISEETRTYIKQVAREMGYTPNPMAQRLQKRATDTLGLILPVFSPRDFDPYFSELLSGIANEATEQGFDLLVTTCAPGQLEEQAYHRLINSRRVDGMIVARPRWEDERIELLQKKRFPFVVIGDTTLDEAIPSITEDTAKGARLMVEHLVEQNHTKIALINAPADLIFAANFFAGFHGGMTKANFPLNEDFVQHTELTQKDGYRAAQTLLSRPDLPSAIMTADDLVALGVMAAAQDQGFEIGSDLAVTGYGDMLLAEHSQPPLTTIYRPTYALGQRACRMLMAQLRGEAINERHVVVEPSLIIRQSSDLALWL
ncbi:MAG: LacI family DNA-binding transcriptional regulator [Chloroflexota bacterium]